VALRRTLRPRLYAVKRNIISFTSQRRLQDAAAARDCTPVNNPFCLLYQAKTIYIALRNEEALRFYGDTY
jgi:hypothetical protein